MAVEVWPTGLGRLCEVLEGSLSEAELKDCPAIIVEKGSAFGLHMLARMRDLSSLVCGVKGGWLRDMLSEDRLTVHFQPIVPVADLGIVFAYECLVRGVGRDGGLLSPGPMFEEAGRAGVLPNLYRAARIKALEEASSHGIPSHIFINFSPLSVHDPRRCLSSTTAAVERYGFSPEKIASRSPGATR